MGGKRSVKYNNVFKTDLRENSDVKINVKIMNPMRFLWKKVKNYKFKLPI